MEGVAIVRQARVPRAWLARFRLAPDGDAEHITERALYVLEPWIQDHLSSPFPFHVKVVVCLHIEKSEETSSFVQHITPWISLPANTSSYRMHRIVTSMRWKLEAAVERAALPDSLWQVVGLEWMDVLVAPGLEMVPEVGPGGRVGQLPESLHQKKGIWCPQIGARCFEFCIRAAFLGVGDMTISQRKNTVRCSGQPFYEETRGRGRPPAGFQNKLVDVGVDFSSVGDEVSLEQLAAFEMSNLGKLEIIVYGWVETEWRGTRRVGEKQLRVPLQEAVDARTPSTRTVILLLHGCHFSLIYNFNAFISQQGVEARWRGSKVIHACPICRSNFKTEAGMKAHFKTAACRMDFEGRTSTISMPEEDADSRVYYRTKPSCELCPILVYADFEVFSEEAAQFAAVEGAQTRVAAAAYAAVGMCGYEPPQKHKLWLEHAAEGDHECAVVFKFLSSLAELAEHYFNWCESEGKKLVWTAEHLEQHRRAQSCRECRRRFGAVRNHGRDTVQKVAHHDHGTGSYLGALCSDCNKAARRHRNITICFHNGGRYDFHFVIRALAKIRYQSLKPATNGNYGKIRTFKPKELARRVALARQTSKIPRVHKLLLHGEVSILQKAGETNLTMDLGYLRFVDTINFCPSGLGKLIDSHRASSTADAPENAFPITAERHPYLRDLQNDKSVIWNALMRKLPMPWDHFRDPADFARPPVWDLECYHSRLSGPCSPKQHEELKDTCHLLRFGSFREVLDCYLALDITAYADLMQIFRTSFFERYHLDVFLYPSLPAASWDASMRQGGGFELVRSLPLYKDLRRCMMGGLCAVFQPRCEADEAGPSQIKYLDINSMYPHAMTKPLPNSAGMEVDLDEDEALRLEWLHEVLSKNSSYQCYLVFVSYDFPESLHDALDFPPPARLTIREGDVGPYTKPSVLGRPPSEKLVPFVGMHEMEGVHSKRLAFLRDRLGARIWKVHRAYVFQCAPRLRRFMVDCYDHRRRLKEQGRNVEQSFVKLCLNSVYGKTVQNQEKYRNATHYFSPTAFSKAQTCRRVADFNVEVLEDDAFLGTVQRVREGRQNVNKSPLQVGWGVLELSKLALAEQYWLGLKRALPRVIPLFTDTDSVCIQIIGDCSPVKLLAEANLRLPIEFGIPIEFDLIGEMSVDEFRRIYAEELSQEALTKLIELRGKLGALSDELSRCTIEDVVCLAVKKYSMLLSDGVEIRKGKGIPRCLLSNARHNDYVQTHLENSTSRGSFTQLRSSQHQVFIVTQTKKTFNVLIDKAYQLTRTYCRPMGHWKNSLLGVWLRLGRRDALLQLILEFVRGIPPNMNPAWGSLLRSLPRR